MEHARGSVEREPNTVPSDNGNARFVVESTVKAVLCTAPHPKVSFTVLGPIMLDLSLALSRKVSYRMRRCVEGSNY